MVGGSKELNLLSKVRCVHIYTHKGVFTPILFSQIVAILLCMILFHIQYTYSTPSRELQGCQ